MAAATRPADATLAWDDLAERPLRPAIAALRDRALTRQRQGLPGVPALALAEAQAWAEHTDDEDWLLWRGRRTAARLAALPIELSPGERIVGRPELRAPTADEAARLAAARPVLDGIPPFPGGDAGHFHPDYAQLFRLGLGGLRRQVEAHRAAAPADRGPFYQACTLALDGLSTYAGRVADACGRAAGADGSPRHWRALEAICRRVATQPPTTFHEALQLMFLTIVGLWFGEDHGLTTPGRMDQTLRPFYEADLAAGRLTRQDALELISCLYIQTNLILGAGSAVSVLVGGRDRAGTDATCDLTYLCLAARRATRLVYPTVGLAWHEGTPLALTAFACRLLRTGLGDPAFFNDELIGAGLRDHGVSVADARDYMNSTCVEIKVVGASHIWVASPYFNCAQILLDAIDRVADGQAAPPATFAAFEDLVRSGFAAAVGAAARQLDEVWRRRAETGGFPLASCFIHDCLERGLDFDRGGARYHWVENSFVGLANLADGLIAVERLVYAEGALTLTQLRDALRADFAGHERLRQRILNRLPHYGNDDPEADAVAARWARTLQQVTAACTVGDHAYVPGFFCWIMHGRLGADTGATPDGRHAGAALADCAGAAQGRERAGPTAAVLSTTTWSHRPALGGLVHNVKLTRAVLDSDAGLRGLRSLIETYLRRGGFEIQVNVVSAEILRAAQAHPEEHADLLVRVAGYSDYFVHLDATLQAEVIARTQHGL